MHLLQPPTQREAIKNLRGGAKSSDPRNGEYGEEIKGGNQCLKVREKARQEHEYYRIMISNETCLLSAFYKGESQARLKVSSSHASSHCLTVEPGNKLGSFVHQ